MLQHSRTANLGEVSSALLRAQLSLALVGSELTGLQVQVQVQVQVALRLTVSQSVSLGIEHPPGAHDQIFIAHRLLRSCFCDLRT
jgi:hypothetical protein